MSAVCGTGYTKSHGHASKCTARAKPSERSPLLGTSAQARLPRGATLDFESQRPASSVSLNAAAAWRAYEIQLSTSPSETQEHSTVTGTVCTIQTHSKKVRGAAVRGRRIHYPESTRVSRSDTRRYRRLEFHHGRRRKPGNLAIEFSKDRTRCGAPEGGGARRQPGGWIAAKGMTNSVSATPDES